jgi:hypothetical protein
VAHVARFKRGAVTLKVASVPDLFATGGSLIVEGSLARVLPDWLLRPKVSALLKLGMRGKSALALLVIAKQIFPLALRVQTLAADNIGTSARLAERVLQDKLRKRVGAPDGRGAFTRSPLVVFLLGKLKGSFSRESVRNITGVIFIVFCNFVYFSDERHVFIVVIESHVVVSGSSVATQLSQDN